MQLGMRMRFQYLQLGSWLPSATQSSLGQQLDHLCVNCNKCQSSCSNAEITNNEGSDNMRYAIRDSALLWNF
jgi:heterodisulfide reductase subunit C